MKNIPTFEQYLKLHESDDLSQDIWSLLISPSISNFELGVQILSGQQENIPKSEFKKMSEFIKFINKNLKNLKSQNFFDFSKNKMKYSEKDFEFIKNINCSTFTFSWNDKKIDFENIEFLNSVEEFVLYGIVPSSETVSNFPKQVDGLTINCCVFRVIKNLPKNLKRISILLSGVIEIDYLPDTIEELVIDGNNLEILPNIPENAKKVYITNSKLEVLPKLPEGLEVLILNGNLLKELPTLPKSLKKINYKNNPLSQIPEINDNVKVL